MKKIVWEDNLSIGVEAIDDQHKHWIDHFNSAVEVLATVQSPKQIIKTLDFLIDYTEFHFSTEEKYMTGSDYPGLEEHKTIHDELRRTLADLLQDFEEEGATYILAKNVDAFLGNWLIKHIQEVDMKFGAFIKEKGIVLSNKS
jgi:hemerythrin